MNLIFGGKIQPSEVDALTLREALQLHREGVEYFERQKASQS